MTTGFGTRLYCLGYGFHGALTEAQGEQLSRDLVLAIGMIEGPGSVMFRYPERNLGWTHIRSLVESYIAIDYWTPDVDRPEGGYIAVVSCKDFEEAVARKIIGDAGLEVVSSSDTELSI